MESRMTRAPVFYTLAQVQFNPIAKMSDYIAPLQEHLRRSGFPDFRLEQQIGLLIRRLDESQPDIQPQQQMRWSFTNSQRTEGYLLVSNALVFHTTLYDTFEDFLLKTISGLKLVHKIVELAYVERIGLRYLDAIVALDDDRKVQDYISPSLLGLSGELGGNLIHSFTETAAVVGDGNLVARSLITEGGLAISPDLAPLQLELQPRFREINGENVVLDMDYSITKRSDFDIAAVERTLVSAHDVHTNAFKVSVTDYARKKWA